MTQLQIMILMISSDNNHTVKKRPVNLFHSGEPCVFQLYTATNRNSLSSIQAILGQFIFLKVFFSAKSRELHVVAHCYIVIFPKRLKIS